MSNKVEATFHGADEELEATYLRLVRRQAQTQIDRDKARDEVDRLKATIDRVRAVAETGPRYPFKVQVLAILDGPAQ